jgi:hypothetical protein
MLSVAYPDFYFGGGFKFLLRGPVAPFIEFVGVSGRRKHARKRRVCDIKFRLDDAPPVGLGAKPQPQKLSAITLQNHELKV